MIVLIKIVFSFVFSYLLGSIPTGYLAGRVCQGIDIREHGSKNMGATNVFRVLGKVPGIIVLLLDVIKGVLAVALVPSLLGLQGNLVYIFCGLVAVCGHNWTVFLKFKGGKGVATSLGVFIGLTIQIATLRLAVALCVLAWLIVFVASGYVSLASLIAAAALPLLMVLFVQPIELIMLGVVFCSLVVLRHRSNIQRLLQGRESRFRFPFRKS